MAVRHLAFALVVSVLNSPTLQASETPSFPKPDDRGNGCTTTLLSDGKMLIAGGKGLPQGDPYLASAKIYDPATGKWSVTGSLNTAREGHTATLLPDGKVLVAGGHGGDRTAYLRTAELHDPASGTWTVTGSLNMGSVGHKATLTNGVVRVDGGYPGHNERYLPETYDPATGTLPIPAARSFHTATLLPDGKVLVAGGQSHYGSWLSSTETYDPANGTWRNAGALTVGRFVHTATLLSNGNVLIAGGQWRQCLSFKRGVV